MIVLVAGWIAYAFHFEQVFVNVDDEAVRLNRKSLCGWIYRLFADSFADLYLIETTDDAT